MPVYVPDFITMRWHQEEHIFLLVIQRRKGDFSSLIRSFVCQRTHFFFLSWSGFEVCYQIVAMLDWINMKKKCRACDRSKDRYRDGPKAIPGCSLHTIMRTHTSNRGTRPSAKELIQPLNQFISSCTLRKNVFVWKWIFWSSSIIVDFIGSSGPHWISWINKTQQFQGEHIPFFVLLPPLHCVECQCTRLAYFGHGVVRKLLKYFYRFLVANCCEGFRCLPN